MVLCSLLHMIVLCKISNLIALFHVGCIQVHCKVDRKYMPSCRHLSFDSNNFTRTPAMLTEFLLFHDKWEERNNIYIYVCVCVCKLCVRQIHTSSMHIIHIRWYCHLVKQLILPFEIRHPLWPFLSVVVHRLRRHHHLYSQGHVWAHLRRRRLRHCPDSR